MTYTLQSPRATVVKSYEVLTPAEQVRVLNVLHDRLRDRVLAALALGAGLRASELTGVTVRAEVDESSERMQAKTRHAQLQKKPYMLVVGDKEAEAGAVAVRLRSGEDLKAKPLAEFIALAKAAIEKKE